MQLRDGPGGDALTAPTLTSVPSFTLIKSDRYIDKAGGSVGGAAVSLDASIANVVLQSCRAAKVQGIIMKLEHVNCSLCIANDFSKCHK